MKKMNKEIKDNMFIYAIVCPRVCLYSGLCRNSVSRPFPSHACLAVDACLDVCVRASVFAVCVMQGDSSICSL